MKKLRFKFLYAVVGAIALFSCEEIDKPTLNPAAVIVPELSATEVVLTDEAVGQDVLTISWDQPDYGFQASPAYSIYIDKADGDFSAPVAVSNGSSISKVFKTEELNKYLLNLGLEAGVESVVQIKVEGKLGTYESLVSEVINLTVTPYAAFLDLTTNWGIVGSGYNNWGAFPDAPFFKTKTQDVLVAYVTLLDGMIKFRTNNAWDTNLGDNGTDGTLEAGGSDIPVTAGIYKVTLNPVANTYSIAAFSYGIVGSAYNDWGADGPDYPFTYDDATDQWRAIVKLKDGKFKIRKNNDWGLNYGDNGADGTLESGGADIEVTAGKYQITFNENDLTIEIVSIPNIWGLVGSAYNDWGATADAQFDRDWRNDNVWVLKNVKLLDGMFKIRDDNAWSTNYGDNGADGSLELNGADIPATAGYYKITIDFNTANPTMTTVKY